MIYRIDVSPATAPPDTAAQDPVGEAIRRQIAEFQPAVGPIHSNRIFLIDTDATPAQIDKAARELLADPIVEAAQVIDSAPSNTHSSPAASRIEIHLKPGVMDPVAASTEMALRDMGIEARQVRTGRAYLFQNELPRHRLDEIARRVLANGVIESVHFEPYTPAQFESIRPCVLQLRHVPLRDLDDDQLAALSRSGHLFLSLDEMKAIQDYFRAQEREPTDVELETLAQTWSEHCVHKTLKSAVDVEVRDAEGQLISSRRYENLIKETIFKSTMDLTSGGSDTSFCLSVFADNAGVIAFDETDAVCFKVETHNHPSAIEPYGGSATGIGGVIRDILGTGLGAKPIANSDVFCVARCPAPGQPDTRQSLPPGVIHPKRILQQVVAGVRDYGNRMGIPTVNGAVYFDDRYLGNPLVFCGCVGLIPRDRIAKESRPGDAIIVMGGRTGRDGIHGATFSSAELTDTHASEFSHAVQIGNAITEKKVADVILQARDRGLFSAITDCGAGGLSSAIGEMGAQIGARVQLDAVPLKYQGLRYDEIWISEAQERMVLAVPPDRVDELLALSRAEDVESTVIGTFGADDNQLILLHGQTQVGRLSMDFLHHGIPKPLRRAVVIDRAGIAASPAPSSIDPDLTPQLRADTRAHLLAALAHPNIASKHWIIRQYDHEVQGTSVIKPLLGPRQIGPSDAAVLRPKLGSPRGIAIGCGLAPHIKDPYRMTVTAIDEAIRNVVAVGAEPAKIALLDNFCWPSVDDESTMGSLVRACEACADAAAAYSIPFISGKDSLHNQFTNRETGQVIRIPNTLLISAIAVIPDIRRCRTMDFKTPGNLLGLVRQLNIEPELPELASTHRMMAAAMDAGLIVSCHDVSDGGMLTAAAEMAIASGIGLDLHSSPASFFRETPGEYLVEFKPEHSEELKDEFDSLRTTFEICGQLTPEPRLAIANARPAAITISIDDLTAAWRGTLDW